MMNIDEALNQGLEHHRHGRYREAEALYRQVLEEAPDHPDANHLLGVLAHQIGQNEAAVQLITRAIRMQGSVAVFHNNLGEALRMLGRNADAIAAFRQAIRLDADHAEAHNNLGTVYQTQGRFDEALACYERAIALKPDYANAHYNRGRTLLGLGDFRQGCVEYEWRWRKPEFARLPLAEPEWDGSPLAGRTLLVRAEQGLGDTLQFIRYLPLASARVGKVVAEVQGALVPLLKQSGFAQLVPQGATLPAFDVHAHLLSLMGLLGTTLETIPAGAPYLAADPELVAHWRGRLAPIEGFKVGIQWQGRADSPQPWRSFSLGALAPVAGVPGVRLVSLQKGFGSEQVAAEGGRLNVVDFGPNLDEARGPFMDTAALMKGLDLVITSDSATAHLAGGLGVPVWVALPLAADWRWLTARDDSPWYPTMRLFRQATQGDWVEVFARVAEVLNALVGRH
jgi:tetratricopeptide (TPR) repeat protein